MDPQVMPTVRNKWFTDDISLLTSCKQVLRYILFKNVNEDISLAAACFKNIYVL